MTSRQKSWLGIIMLLALVCAFPSFIYGKKEAPSPPASGSIEDLALQIVKSMIEAKVKKIAILPFRDLNNNVNSYGIFVAEELTYRIFLVKHFEVVERQLLDQVINELALNETALIDQRAAKEIGKILGVDAILTGTVTDVGDAVVINARLIGTETGQILAAARTQFPMDARIKKLLNTAPPPKTPSVPSHPMAHPTPSTVSPPASAPAAPATPPPQNPPAKKEVRAASENMSLVPAGAFFMGSDNGFQECKRVQQQCETHLFDDERPRHQVYLDSFFIDVHEIANQEYDECVAKGACIPKAIHPGFTDPRQPVAGVTWFQAKAFCEWKGKRLPTEAEWEKAARGTDERMYPWGGKIDCTLANYSNCGRNNTIAVGSYTTAVSPYGIMDMAGNAREWVSDWYQEDYYRISPSSNPRGPESGKYKVLRGGAYNSEAAFVRVSARTKRVPDGEWDTTGFRCAKAGS